MSNRGCVTIHVTVQTDRKPPFPDIQAALHRPGAVKGREAAKRTLDGEDRCETISDRERGVVREPSLPRAFQRGNQGRSRQRHRRGSKPSLDVINPRYRTLAGLATRSSAARCQLRITTDYDRDAGTFGARFPCCRRRFKNSCEQPLRCFRRAACSGPERSDGTESARRVTATGCR